MNRVKEKLNKKECVQGVYVSIPSEDIAELLSLAGYDFIVVDLEHSNIGYEKLTGMFRAIEIGHALPFVRVSSSNPVEIQKVLDCGALGIHLPSVESKEELENVLSFIKYHDMGRRGASFSVRSGRYGFMTKRDQIEKAENDILTVVAIESRKGVENIDSILSVDGIDVLNIALTDLSQSYGFEDKKDPEFKAIVKYLTDKALEKGLSVGGTTGDFEDMEEQLRNGASYFKIPNGTSLIREVFQEYHRKTQELFKNHEGGILHGN